MSALPFDRHGATPLERVLPVLTRQPEVHIEVIKGTHGFSRACAAAAVTLAMSHSAWGVSLSDAASAAVQTPAAFRAIRLMSDQTLVANAVSAAQQRTLAYGFFQPVKTSLHVAGSREVHWTLHPFDMVRLAREAASTLRQQGGGSVSPARIGAVLLAESAMVARTGLSANGKTPSFGLAQLEAATARSLGIADPEDPRQAALGAAKLLSEGQRFARANQHVDPAIALSLNYNTSSALRRQLIERHGASLSMADLPKPTQHHVQNMQFGEKLMVRFESLYDQHQTMARKLDLAQANRSISAPITSGLGPTSTTPSSPPLAQETIMQTSAHIPSTKNLLLVNSTQADIARRVHNQVALEKAGHPQAMPMTHAGLQRMQTAVAELYAKVGPQTSHALSIKEGGFKEVLYNLPEALIDTVRAHFNAVSELAKGVYNSPSALQLREGIAAQVNEARHTVEQVAKSFPQSLSEAERERELRRDGGMIPR